MARKGEEEKENNEPVEWSPDQPIPDEDGETEAQRRHMLQRRLDYLNRTAEEKDKKGKKDGKDGKDGKKPWLIGA